MTTERTYRCNMCRDPIAPQDDNGRKQGFGVYFLAGGKSVFRRMSECEHHVCHQCAQSLHDELRKVTPARPAA